MHGVISTPRPPKRPPLAHLVPDPDRKLKVLALIALLSLTLLSLSLGSMVNSSFYALAAVCLWLLIFISGVLVLNYRDIQRGYVPHTRDFLPDQD